MGDTQLAPPGTILSGSVSAVGRKRPTAACDDGPITIKFARLTTPNGEEFNVDGHLVQQSYVVGNGSKAKRIRVSADGRISQMGPVTPPQKKTVLRATALALNASMKAVTSSTFLLQSLQARPGKMPGIPGMLGGGGMTGPPPMGMLGGGMLGAPPIGMAGGGAFGSPPMGPGDGGSLSGLLDTSSLMQTVLIGMLKDDNSQESPSSTSTAPEESQDSTTPSEGGSPPPMGMMETGTGAPPSMGMMGGGLGSSPSMGMIGGGLGGGLIAGSPLQDLLQLLPSGIIPGASLLSRFNNPMLMMAARTALPVVMQFLPKVSHFGPGGPPGGFSPPCDMLSGQGGPKLHQASASSSSATSIGSVVHIEPGDELIVSVTIRCDQISHMRVTGKLLGKGQHGSTTSQSAEDNVRLSPLQVTYVSCAPSCCNSSSHTADLEKLSIDLPVSFRTFLDSNTANVGDRVEAVLKGTLSLEDRIVAPTGAVLVGHVARLGDWRARDASLHKLSGRASGNDWITIFFDEFVTPYGERIKLHGVLRKQCVAINNKGKFKIISVNREGAIVATDNVSSASQNRLASLWLGVGFQAATSLVMMRTEMPKLGTFAPPSVMLASAPGGGLMTMMPLLMRVMTPTQLQTPANPVGQMSGVHIDPGDQLSAHLTFDYDSIRRLSLIDPHVRMLVSARIAKSDSSSPPDRVKRRPPTQPKLEVEFMNPIDTRHLMDGDKVKCRLTAQALLSKDLVVPEDSVLLGHVEEVRHTRRMTKAMLSSNGRYRRDASFRIVFTSLTTPNNEHFGIMGIPIPQYHLFNNAGKFRAIHVGNEGRIQKIESLNQTGDDTLKQTIQTVAKTGLLQVVSPAVTFAAMPVLMGIVGASYPCVFSDKPVEKDHTSPTRGFILGATSALPVGGAIRKFLLTGDELVIEEGDRLFIDARIKTTTSLHGTIIGAAAAYLGKAPSDESYPITSEREIPPGGGVD